MILRLIARLELLLAYLYTLVPDAYCEGCPVPEFHGELIPVIAWLEGVLAQLYALVGG